MKATRNTSTSEFKRNSKTPLQKPEIVHATKFVQSVAESRDEKAFIALVLARRTSALKDNSVKVCVDNL